MNVVQFKRPEAPKPPQPTRRTFGEFALAMGALGLAFFMLPTLWPSVPQEMLAVIHLLVAAVYYAQGPKIAAAVWIAVTVVTLVVTSAPSPVTYALFRGAQAFDAALVAATPK